MRLRIPFFKQKLDYDCGPAALKMALAYFGQHAGLRQLMRELRTTEKNGTPRRDLVRVARRRGLKAATRTGATLGEVERLLRGGRAVIIEYILPNEGPHYAVVSGLEKRSILLQDPTAGRYYRLSRPEFRRRWYGRHSKTHTRWVLALAPGPRGK